MSGSNPDGRQGGPLNPQALSLEDVARILTASGWKPVTVDMVRDDIDDGAPVNPARTINLVQYAAARGDSSGTRVLT